MIKLKSFAGAQIPLYEYMDMKTVFTLAAAVAGMGILKKTVSKKFQEKWKDSVPEAIFCIMLLILCLASVTNNTYNPFIYFQF